MKLNRMIGVTVMAIVTASFLLPSCHKDGSFITKRDTTILRDTITQDKIIDTFYRKSKDTIYVPVDAVVAIIDTVILDHDTTYISKDTTVIDTFKHVVNRHHWRVLQVVNTAADGTTNPSKPVAGWTALEINPANKYSVYNLFDGDMNTVWNTPWKNGDYPYHIIVDMTKKEPVKGLYFMQRPNFPDQAPKYIDIYAAFGNEADNFIPVAEHQLLPYDGNGYTPGDTIHIDFTEKVIATFRYFKVVFTEGWASGDASAKNGGTVLDLSELGVY